MYSPKLRPQMVTGDMTKQMRSHDESRSCVSLRTLLIIWATLRLVVSVLWTGIIIISTSQSISSYLHNRASAYVGGRLVFELLAIVAQLVEFGMLVTFITAGVKRRVKLYRPYYYYCIITLIVYIIAVSLCFVLSYEDGHYFGEIYLTYHLNDFGTIQYKYDELIFAIAAILDVCLETLLILLVKKLINKYSYNVDITTGENV